MDYMTVEQAAVRVGISVRGIRKRIEAGTMKAERLGPWLWAISREEVERQQQLGRQKPGPKATGASDGG